MRFFVLLFISCSMLNGEPKLLKHCNRQDVLRELRYYLPDDPVIIECGAHCGQESIALSNFWPNSTIFTFEVVPEHFKRLIQNTQSYDNIYCYNIALADRVGEMTLHLSECENLSDKIAQSSSLLPPKEHLDWEPGVEFKRTIQVPTKTIDAWAQREALDFADLLWLDMQGFELATMKASPQILKTVQAIYTEIETVEAYAGQPLFDEVKEWLQTQGFECVAIDFVEPTSGLYYWFGNALFVRRDSIPMAHIHLPWDLDGKHGAELNIVQKFLPDNPVIVEAGAHYGEDTVVMAKKWPKGTIYAFEPCTSYFKKLETAASNFSNIQIFPWGLYARSETNVFYESKNVDGASSLLQDNQNGIYGDVSIEVYCKNLDEWATENNIKQIDYMWLDMEGAELAMLKAAPNILKTTRALSCEVNFREFRVGMCQFNEVKQFMESSGFTLYTMWGNPRAQATAIFIRSDILQAS